MDNKLGERNVWDLCPSCERPWKFHDYKDGINWLACPAIVQSRGIDEKDEVTL